MEVLIDIMIRCLCAKDLGRSGLLTILEPFRKFIISGCPPDLENLLCSDATCTTQTSRYQLRLQLVQFILFSQTCATMHDRVLQEKAADQLSTCQKCCCLHQAIINVKLG